MEKDSHSDLTSQRGIIRGSRSFAVKRRTTAGIRRAIDFLLPPQCPVCHKAVANGGGVCSACWSSMEFISDPVCQVYGTPFSFNVGENIVSAQAIADPPPFKAARAAVKYGIVAKSLVHRLKYGDRFEAVEPMVTAMNRVGAGLIERCQLIVPVPLHRFRLLSRRFNQAALLAAGLSRRSGVPHDPFVLERRRRTQQQVGLTANERDTNVRGAFTVSAAQSPKIAGRSVLLVDDVYTSGATVKAASRALLRGGAGSVYVLTFANVCR